MFDFAKKRKMSIVADLSRRLHLLTTDAKPDPPRKPSADDADNVPSASDRRSKSCPATPDVNENGAGRTENPLDPRDATAKEEDESDGASSEHEASTNRNEKDSRDQKIPRFKTKSPYKATQTANVVNYNIVNSNGVKIGATKTYVWNVSQCAKSSGECGREANATRGKTRKMPKPVVDLSACDREITVDDIFVIKTHIGHGWRNVARRLGYSEGQLDQFEENHRDKGIDEVIYQALLDWKQANTRNARIGTLLKALWACREYECAERLANAQDTPTYRRSQ